MDFGRISSLCINGLSVETLMIGGRKVWSRRRESGDLRFFAIDDNVKIGFYLWSRGPSVALEYSLDGGSSWRNWNLNGVVTLAHAGDEVVVRAPENHPNTGGFCQAPSYGNYYFLDTSDSGRWGMKGDVDRLVKSDGDVASLPAYCYFHLFNGLYKLSDISGLRICNRAPGANAYYLMFSNCPNLEKGPVFGETDVEGVSSYQQMFTGCSKLSDVSVQWTRWPDVSKTVGWLEGCSATGDFKCPEELPAETGGGRIPVGWTRNGKKIPDLTPYLTFTAEQAGTVVRLEGNDRYLECSTDGENWLPWDQASGTTLANVGDYVKLRATQTVDSLSGNKFVIDGLAAASGELKSIYDRTLSQTTLGYMGARILFQSCYGLTEAPELTWTTIGQQAYEATFGDCVNLRKIRGRFTATGNLYMTCGYMFSGCTSLVDVPYDWFGDDGSFTAQRWGIAYMFARCAMTRAPLCNFSVQNADNAATNIFNGCGNLNEIHVTWISWPPALNSWVAGVAPTGTFYKPASLPEEYGANRIPVGWTVVNV